MISNEASLVLDLVWIHIGQRLRLVELVMGQDIGTLERNDFSAAFTVVIWQPQ